MKDLVRQFRNLFVSLQLTVVLLALGIVLVFAATLDQTNLGVWAVQDKYFRSFFVLWKVGDIPVPVFPGGYLVGGFLFFNLLASHIYRFKFSWKKAGIFLTHVGLLVLLVGELLTGLWQEEFSMRLEKDLARNYSESYLRNELAVIQSDDGKTDNVTAIPEGLLARKGSIEVPELPFRIVVKDYFPNAGLVAAGSVRLDATPITLSDGQKAVLLPQPMTYKQDERNLPGAVIELVALNGGSLGSFMLAAQGGPAVPGRLLVLPHEVTHAGKTWKVILRFKREYKPFTLTLLEFKHDVYTGTDIPKNFSSRVRLTSPDSQDNQEALIYMNNPFRYAGLTFYQASFERDETGATNDKVTVLQVVRNPSRHLPYISCILMGLGLLVQFGIHLFAFLGKRRAAAAAI